MTLNARAKVHQIYEINGYDDDEAFSDTDKGSRVSCGYVARHNPLGGVITMFSNSIHFTYSTI